MRKLLIWIFIVFMYPALSSGSEWFKKNRELEVVFPTSVWEYVVKADRFDDKGNRKLADYYLRLVRKLTDEARPFLATDWPKGWPRNFESLEVLKYATPSAYINRIIGDFAYSHNREKEAIQYYLFYIRKSIIPDLEYMEKLGRIFESESLWKEALLMYHDLYKNLAARNYHGKKFSLRDIALRVKKTEMKLKKVPVFVLNVTFVDIPDFLQKDFNKMFREKIDNLKGVEFIPERDFNKILAEETLTVQELEDDNELSRIGKMLNAQYIIKGILIKIHKYYVLQIRVFNPEKKLWLEDYEYKNQDFRYLPNFVERFIFQFQEEEIPEELYLPESTMKWSYETDSVIVDLKISLDGKKLICGCESGSVYVFSGNGTVLKKFSMKDSIIKVGISPDGNYFSWSCLDGRIYFANSKGFILWDHKFDNLGRSLAISENGKFVAVGINNEIFFLDRKGEIFWKSELSSWLTSISIPQNARRVIAGTETGTVLSFTEEGNLEWKKNMRGKVIRISFSPNGKIVSVENDTGEVIVFNDAGNQIMSFTAGEEKKFTAFSTDILYVLTGKRGKYFYFFSQDKKKLWNYQIDEKVDILESSLEGNSAATVDGKNIFFISVDWK